MNAREELWERVDACLDRGADPREDERVLELLLAAPELADKLADALTALERVQRGAARRARAVPIALASAAAAALLFALLQLQPRAPELREEAAREPGVVELTPPEPLAGRDTSVAPGVEDAAPLARLISFRSELSSDGPNGSRTVQLEYERGRLRERSRRVERVLPPSADMGELRTALVVETLFR